MNHSMNPEFNREMLIRREEVKRHDMWVETDLMQGM